MTNKICEQCWRYDKYKKDCRLYWEGKTECSMFARFEDDKPKLVTEFDFMVEEDN